MSVNYLFTIISYALPVTAEEEAMVQAPSQIKSYQPYEDAALEDRSAPRVRLDIPASMRPSGSRGFAVIVRDLSLSGVACEALTAMSPGTRVWLTLPGLSELQAKIVWNDGTMVGCAFDTLLNPAVMQNILAGFPAKGS